MLNEYDIDILHDTIQKNTYAELYYIAHNTEIREGIMDEVSFKSIPRFKIIKIKVYDIQNAYFEVMNFKNNPDNYHKERIVEYYDMSGEYHHYFTLPNGSGFTSQPSIIYGYVTKYKNLITGEEEYQECPSPVKPVYYNDLTYGDYQGQDLFNAINNGLLDFKYKKLPVQESVDGVKYQYVSSDWYILKVADFPRSEHVLINTHDKTAYFRDLNEAFFYLDQLEA